MLEKAEARVDMLIRLRFNVTTAVFYNLVSSYTYMKTILYTTIGSHTFKKTIPLRVSKRQKERKKKERGNVKVASRRLPRAIRNSQAP